MAIHLLGRLAKFAEVVLDRVVGHVATIQAGDVGNVDLIHGGDDGGEQAILDTLVLPINRHREMVGFGVGSVKG